MANEPRRITEYAATLLAGPPTGAALVLFVDQMEELFTIVAKSHQTAFLDLLAHAAGDPRLRVLATLRADFLSQAVTKPTLRPLLLPSTVRRQQPVSIGWRPNVASNCESSGSARTTAMVAGEGRFGPGTHASNAG